MPAAAADVAAPIRKLWLLNADPYPAAVKMERSQWLTIGGDSGTPADVMNRGPGVSPRMARYERTATTGHIGFPEDPMCSMTPWQKGSVLEVFSQRWMVPASAIETSTGVKWVLGSKVVGHVNSATRRKPKKARQHAAQNMRWSNKSNARERWMTLSRGAVIGNRDKREGAAC